VRNLPQQLADVLTTYTKSIILLLLVVTVLIGAGLPMVEQDSDTEQFESDSPAVEAQDIFRKISSSKTDRIRRRSN